MRYSKSLKAKKIYTDDVGKLIWAWNDLQGTLSYIFGHLIDSNEPNVGLAIWHALSSDTAQRECLAAIMEQRLKGNPVHTRLKWVLKKINKIRDYRNSIVHAPMTVIKFKNGPYAIPHPIKANEKHEMRVLAARVKRKIPTLIKDLEKMNDYSEILFSLLLEGKRKPLPQKPRLRSLPI